MAGKKRDHAPPQPQARGPVYADIDAFRREVVALHQAIFKHNQRRINASVSGYSAAFRRYEREYARGVRSYRRRATVSELDRALSRADVVYVGDYHTLAQAQRSFLRLLRRLPHDRPVTVALEFVQGKYQRSIDAFLAGQIDEATFLRSIRHSAQTGFGSWPSFAAIFEMARERGYRVIGIDSPGRGARSLEQRDRYAARRLIQARRAHPDALLMVLAGELHVAPQHLPEAVAREAAALGRAVGPPLRALILYQNCEKIYAALVERGLEHDVEIVQVARGQYCLINTPPIVCQQSFLNWLYADEDGEQIEAPEHTFKEYVRIIASFFELPMGDALDEVELNTVVDLSFLQRLRRRGDFSSHDMKMIKRQVLNSESYYIPRAKMVYLGNLSVNHVSEEATHFLRHVCADIEDPKLLVDAFYARCIEEALGFLGSKVINHKRKRPGLQYFRRVRASSTATPREKELARLVLKHATMEQGRKVRGMNEVYECDADMFNAVTHVLGYRLGDKMYYGLLDGVLRKAEVRDLFFDTFEEEGTALSTYLYLQARTAGVRSPTPL
ncbi:MAG TPA: ChaN family lipoprotein [Myxococcota bacterium]|nr:ChaN family lipoprotein [Myxococcota bacterium]